MTDHIVSFDEEMYEKLRSIRISNETDRNVVRRLMGLQPKFKKAYGRHPRPELSDERLNECWLGSRSAKKQMSVPECTFTTCRYFERCITSLHGGAQP